MGIDLEVGEDVHFKRTLGGASCNERTMWRRKTKGLASSLASATTHLWHRPAAQRLVP